MAMDLLAEGLVGGVGGLLGRLAAFPFDTLKVKMATSNTPNVGLAALLRSILATEGVAGLYRGLIPFSALEGMNQKFLYLMAFTYIKRLHERLLGRTPGTAATVLCGYVSDLVCVPISMPFEALTVQLQAAPPDASKSAIIRKAFTREGILSALKSGRAYFVLSLKPGFEFAIFDRIKQSILESRGAVPGANLRPLTAFLLGAVSRAIATCFVYPYARGKALSQAKLAPSAYAAVCTVFETEGALALYRGLSMEVMRGMTQSAVMFAVMEQVRAAIRKRLRLS
mmetsp:Transcript_46749/g.75812  ORF Transcript_46749/g.75812 Transcript_46749/m.75812 type:complete len:283 (+) Transcript_46749:75-923(+)